jgi:carbon monoxide dehydrogenase subunit G
MKLTNEITVPAPLERTWSLLLDVPRVVRALPGATVEPDGAEGVYRGALKVRLGPVAMEYEGTARLEDVDEDEHVATFRVEGRERRGHGGATATIVNRLVPVENGTRLVVETDLSVTGRAAQLGRGLMEDVAGRLLEQFAHGLETALLGRAEEAAPVAGAAAELDIGAAAWEPLLRRYGPIVGVGVGAFLLGLALGRR